MKRIFVISDTHFGDEDMIMLGIRQFKTTYEMDEYIIKQWNSVVTPFDRVYHLGDVAMQRRDIATVGRCNGQKRLVTGNHDIYDWKKDYSPYFKKVFGIKIMDGLALSHVPMHPDSVKDIWINVHGHVHRQDTHLGLPKYFNVSAEVLDYKPILLSEILTKGKTIVK